ncbi:hypothetical protein [Actinomycetospora termitidis]|uniref:Portal protein n=1 Tax=Actinomycetospora termitidis TaxID=3053470 RepID=A0ABT7MFJ3_9PSEU|nr:hypothetical protein [Actinomycetospora sp. Odt1-22]MDL5159425.1 hypothetical protein [Actinomycetospora sp. Odt1-22]
MTTAVQPTTGAAVADQNQRWATREDYLADLENQRRDGIKGRRLYYAGEQYDLDNALCMAEVRKQGGDIRSPGEKGIARAALDLFHLPEHLRRHAYSTQLAECVDFIADRLADGFTVESSADGKRPSGDSDRDDRRTDPVQTIIDSCLAASPALSGGDDDDDQLTIATLLREAGKAGDVPVLVRWDNVEQHAWLELWNSEQVEMRFVDDHPDRLERVLVDQMDWRVVPGGVGNGEPEQCTIRREWVLSDAPEGAAGDPDTDGPRERRCVERVYIIDKGDEIAERPAEVIEWGSPVLPWWVIRVEHRDLRDTRGSSLITEQVMRHADRYNAVEQLSFLIARANSHSTVVLTGEVMPPGAVPGGQGAGKEQVVRRDVLDAAIFPGQVNATALSLPTDPQMIEHQRKVLLEALYGSFGLRRSDAEAVADTGQVSGYALEILNQKDAGTFARIRTLLIRDIKRLLGVVVDCHAAWVSGATTPPDPADDDPATADPNAELGTEEGDRPTTGARGDTDPYPNRRIIVSLGTGWIVDEAKFRDDFNAKALSRRGMWRERGRPEDWIDRNEEELDEEGAKAVEQAQKRMEATGLGEGGRFGAQTSAQSGQDAAAGRTGAIRGGSSSTAQAGRTTGDARPPSGRDQAVGANANGRSER